MLEAVSDFLKASNVAQMCIVLGVLASFLEDAASPTREAAKTPKDYISENIGPIVHAVINALLYAALHWAINVTQFETLRAGMEIIALGILVYLSGHLTTLMLAAIASSLAYDRNAR